MFPRIKRWHHAIIYSLLYLLIFIEFLHPVDAMTQDLGRHILTGDIILRNHTVPKFNLLTYTFGDYAFINHHWGSEVIFALIYHLSGINGLLLAGTVTILAAWFILFKYTKHSSSILGITITTLLYLGILFERTAIRPELFSFLLLSAFVVILFKNRERPAKLLYLLPFFELIWVNLHIYFFIGIITWVLFLIDAVFTHRKKLNNSYIQQLAATTGLVALATLLNPNGIKGALYPLTVFNNYGYTIEENQNLFFLQGLMRNPVIVITELSIVILFLLLLYQWKKTRPIDWLLSICFSIFALMAIRNVPLFVFATFPVFAKYLSCTLDNVEDIIKKKTPKVSPQTIFITVTLILISWGIGETTWFVGSKGFGVGEVTGARTAADFYINNHISGPIFNNFDIGSYLEFRLYPKQKVFVDGRPEAFPATFFTKAYIPMQQNISAFNDVDNTLHFNSIFFEHTDQTPWAAQFIKLITADPNWKIVYLDDTVVILLKNSDTNKSLIEKYPIDQTTVDFVPPADKTALLHYANFFAEAGWTKQEMIANEAILKEDETNCVALYNMSNLMSQQSVPLATIYMNKYTAYCK